MPRDPATHVGVALLIGHTEVPCDVAPDGGPAALSGLSVTWGRSTSLDEPAASTCNFTLADPDGGPTYTTLVRDGAVVRVYAVAPGGARTEVFVGYVSDISVTHDGDTDAEVAVTAIDMTARVAAMPLQGIFSSARDVSFPAQSATNRRTAMRDLMDIGAFAIEVPAMADGSGSSALAPYQADAPKAWEAWTAFYSGLGFVVWPVGAYSESLQNLTVRVVTTYATEFYPYTRDISRASARVPLAPLTDEDSTAKAPLPAPVLRACDVVLEGATFGVGTGVIDTSTQQLRVNYTDSGQVARSVARGSSSQVVTLDSWVNNATDAGEAADRLWWSIPSTAGGFDETWSVEGITVDPDLVTETDNFHQAMLAMLDQAARILRPVVLFELPAWVPWRYSTDPTLWVDNLVALLNGGTYAYTDGRWVLNLMLVVHRPVSSSVASRVVVTPGATVSVRHDDARVVASPSTRWQQQYATFSDGKYIWSGSAWVAPLYVSAGDAPNVASTNWQVIPDPETAWPSGDSALFTNGPFGWTGTAWTARAMTPQPWGDYPSMAHDDPRWTDPASFWAPGNYATFSDGPWRYAGGGAWRPVTLTHPGDTVSGSLDNAGPVPHTEWDHTFATFTIVGGGTRRWDGTAWVRVNVARPGATNAGGWPSTDPNTVPDPHDAWAPGQWVTLSDGTFRWSGDAWAAVVPATPGSTVPAPHDDPAVSPWPATAWDADDYATFSDGAYTWDGEAWTPATSWQVVRTNYASNPHVASADGWRWSPGMGGAGTTTVETGTDTPDGLPGYQRGTVTTPDTGGYSGHRYDEVHDGIAGDVVTVSMYVRPSVDLTYTLNLSTRVGLLTGDSAASAATLCPAGVWTRLAATVTATKAYEGVRGVANEAEVGPAAGFTTDATCLLIEFVSSVAPYFDGDTPDTDTERHDWTAAAGASPSVQSARVPIDG